MKLEMDRRIILERDAPFRRRFVLRLEPALVGEQPSLFKDRAEALAVALDWQKRLTLPLIDQSGA